jgi:hypothetical protein
LRFGYGVLQNAVGRSDLTLNCLNILADFVVGVAKFSA